MTLGDRLRRGAKALTMAFSGALSSGWSVFVGRSRIDFEREVGDPLGNSIVAATLGWIARNFPEAPFRVRQYDAEHEPQATQDVGAVRMMALLRKPNPFFSGILLWMATILDFWAHGNAVWLKVRGGPGGAITELWWVPWGMIKPKWPTNGSEYISHYIYKPESREIRVEVEDVVHFRFGLDPDNIRIGRSPLKSIIREVYTDDEAAQFSATLLKNLGVPGLVVSPDDDSIIDPEGATSIKRKVQETFGGDKRGEPMVLSAKSKIMVLSFSPQQMNLKDLRRVPEERVSGVTGVPAIVAGLGAGLDRSTFANFEEARAAGWEENIIPSQDILASQLEVQLLPEFVANPDDFLPDFDVSEVRVLQEDQNKLWERAGAALAKGAITLATFNQIVGLPVAKDKSDRVYLRPFNVVEVPENPNDREENEEEPEADSTPPNPEELPEIVPVDGSTNGNGRVPVEA
jgi:HK97 family phage portal protein